MLAADRAAREAGVNGVPSFFLDGYGLYSGAMPAETMAEALRKGQQILRQARGDSAALKPLRLVASDRWLSL